MTGDTGLWRRGDGTAVLMLGAVTLLFFYPVLMGQVPCGRDTFIDCYPWRIFTRDALRAGEIPLWNPYSCCGKPFVANSQSAVFYPLHLLFYVLPLPWALSVATVLHVFLAGLFTYLLVRHFSTSRAGSLLSAVSFMFSPMLLCRIEFMALFNCLIWTPLALLCLDRALVRPSGPRLVSLAVVLAIQLLSGYPNEFMFCLIILSIWWISTLLSRRLGAAGQQIRLAIFPAALVLAAGLAALQILPTLELIPLSIRAQTDPAVDQGSLSPLGLLTSIFPYLMGHPGPAPAFWAPSIFEFWLGIAFVGIPPLLLAACAIGESSFVARFAGFVAFLALWVAMGKYTPLFSIIKHLVPFFDTIRWPSKVLSISVLFLSVLAGRGLDRLRQQATWFHARTFMAVTLAASLFLVVLERLPILMVLITGGVESKLARFPPVEVEKCARIVLSESWPSCVVLLACAAVAGLAASRIISGTRCAHALLLLTVLQLFKVDAPLLYFAPPEIYQMEPSLPQGIERDRYRILTPYHYLQQELYDCRDPDRYRWARAAFVGDARLPDRIFRDWGGDALRLKDYFRFHQLMSAPRESSFPRERFLDLAAMKYVVVASSRPDAEKLPLHQQRISLAPRDTALPRAMIVGAARVITDHATVVEALKDPAFIPRREAILEDAPELPLTGQGTGTVDTLETHLNSVSVTVTCTADALLLVNDVHYPGWAAELDGHPVRIHRANYTFRAVCVPRGRHHIVMKYQPRSFEYGVWISALSLLIAALLVV